jgi:hypothetical protein
MLGRSNKHHSLPYRLPLSGFLSKTPRPKTVNSLTTIKAILSLQNPKTKDRQLSDEEAKSDTFTSQLIRFTCSRLRPFYPLEIESALACITDWSIETYNEDSPYYFTSLLYQVSLCRILPAKRKLAFRQRRWWPLTVVTLIVHSQCAGKLPSAQNDGIKIQRHRCLSQRGRSHELRSLLLLIPWPHRPFVKALTM